MLKKMIALLIALFLFFTVKTGFTKTETSKKFSFGEAISLNLSVLKD